jgi:hypothetical protein
VTEYHLGPGALLERLSIIGSVFGLRSRLLIAQWDQIDVHRPDAPRLLCPASELKVRR